MEKGEKEPTLGHSEALQVQNKRGKCRNQSVQVPGRGGQAGKAGSTARKEAHSWKEKGQGDHWEGRTLSRKRRLPGPGTGRSGANGNLCRSKDGWWLSMFPN